MPKEKAAIFVDNSNIFYGMERFSRSLRQQGKIGGDQVLRIDWSKLLKFLEHKFGERDIFARHFFASIPPRGDVEGLHRYPTEEEWQEIIRQSAQSEFYRTIQRSPYNFQLHPIPLRRADVFCRKLMRPAVHKCLQASAGEWQCTAGVDLDECKTCTKKYLKTWEKGLDVALSVELVKCVISSSALETVIIAAGDGDYKEAAKYARQEHGKNVQIVSWASALASDLEEVANQDTVILEECWQILCFPRAYKEVRDEVPVEVAEEVEEEEE